MTEPSRNAIDRLGRRLSRQPAGPHDPADLALYEEWLASRQPALDRVELALRRRFPRVPCSSRLKTIETTADKIARDRIDLTRIRDIAGVRIVTKRGRRGQDRIVQEIATMFRDHQVVDRRLVPNHGYRAVHVIVKVDGVPVEVQVRTEWQDQWAQLVERLGDVWGRQIRYGGLPTENDASRRRGRSRAETWASVLKLSDQIARVEEAEVSLARVRHHLRHNGARGRLRWSIALLAVWPLMMTARIMFAMIVAGLRRSLARDASL